MLSLLQDVAILINSTRSNNLDSFKEIVVKYEIDGDHISYCLRTASMYGSIRAIQWLINTYSEFVTLEMETSCFKRGCYHGHIDVVEFFHSRIDESAYPDSLRRAICKNHISIVNLLISYGVDVNVEVESIHESYLHLAIEKRNFEIAEILISHGVSVDISNQYMPTPLVMSVLKCDLKGVIFTVEHGADVFACVETSTWYVTHNNTRASELRAAQDYCVRDECPYNDAIHQYLIQHETKRRLLVLQHYTNLPDELIKILYTYKC